MDSHGETNSTDDQQPSATTSNGQSPDTAQDPTMAGILRSIQDSLVQLTNASISQTQALKSMQDDLVLQPEVESGSEDEENEPNDPTQIVNALLDPSKGAMNEGRDVHPDSEVDVLDGLTQAFLPNTKKSSAIDEKIASLIDNILVGELSADLVKEKGEKYPPPENCKHLVTVTVNEEIWDLITHRNKSIDLAFQKVQEPLTQGLSALTLLADRVAKDIKESKTIDPRATLNHLMDSIALIGHTNWQLNMKRREIIKVDLNPPYTRLCKEEIKTSTKLFGDELSKHLKEMTEAKKAGQQMQKSSSATTHKQKGQRPKPYDRASTSTRQTFHRNRSTYKRPFLWHSRASTQATTTQKKTTRKPQ